MVSHCHELGQSWVPEDGIVWQADVGDVEVNELGVVIVALPKGDRKTYMPYRNSGTISDPTERLGRLKLIVWHLEIVEHLDGQDIESCSTVDEGLGDFTLLMTGEQSIGRTPAVATHLS